MVTVTNYQQRSTAEGKQFFVLELLGDVELVYSQNTGRPYATARKAFLPTTFDEVFCTQMIGKQMPGSISKVLTDEPYELEVKETGEILTLNHRYEYSSTDPDQSTEQAVFPAERITVGV